jgi:hypothetical protein
VVDQLAVRLNPLLVGAYDCVDRVVLNAYFPIGHNPGGFRCWWRRLHDGSEAQLDNTHLMRMAGRFARRVQAWGRANQVPVISCKPGDRQHRIAEQYLANHPVTKPGVFLVLVGRGPAVVWKVKRSPRGNITNLQRRYEHVNHYAFHIMDPQWGHVTIRMSGHPPFGAQIMLNGHEYVACQARRAGIPFAKEGNCFTAVADSTGLAQVADALSQHATVGRLSQVCNRWLYTTCLCFGLDLAEQARSGFSYALSVYQIEYSRNLLFRDGAQMNRWFQCMIDRSRSRLDVPKVRTLFGARQRPHRSRRDHRNRASGPPRFEAVIETPRYDLTIFKVHFGPLTLKAYTKGEHVLRLEATALNTTELRRGRLLDRFPDMVDQLAAMLTRFCTTLDCVDTSFLPDQFLDQLPTPAQLGATRVGGIDLNKPRIRAVLTATIALAAAPNGFTINDLTNKIHKMAGHTDYTTRRAAYDLRKLRGKQLVDKPGRGRRYHVPPQAARTITALLTLRDHLTAPTLAGIHNHGRGPEPTNPTPIDHHYAQLRTDIHTLLDHLGITTETIAA